MDDDDSVDLYGDLDGFGTSPIKANKLLISPPSVSNGERIQPHLIVDHCINRHTSWIRL